MKQEICNMLNSLKASNILFVNDALVPFWIMQGLLAQWDLRVGYSTEKLLYNRRFFGLRPFCIYPGMSILFLFGVSLLWVSDLFLN